MQAGRADDESTHPNMKCGHPERTEDDVRKTRKKKKNVLKVSRNLVGNKRPLNGYVLYY